MTQLPTARQTAFDQREEQMRHLRDRLRPGQQRMADWQSGPLAVSAVPGSGKSTGMAIASALLIAQRYQTATSLLAPTRQLILVTFTRSAAANLKAKIRGYLRDLLLPPLGFSVYTLHGLALNIAMRHPDLSGLTLDQMTLVSPNQSNRLIRTAVEQWIYANPVLYQQLLEGRQFDGEETERLRRQSVLRTEVLPDLAYSTIREAKSSGLLPQQLQDVSQTAIRRIMSHDESGNSGSDFDVLAIAAGLYDHYQRLLQQRAFIDYDDMILAALRVLANESARQLWQEQIFGVFEDEAQDSSPLQTRLLELLASHPSDPQQPLNLVRVGDPNQAINSTFTPADPIFFRQFCEACDRHQRLAEMNQAGRSTQPIIDAANFMLTWVNQHIGGSNIELPFRPQVIHAVSPGDPQADANPFPEGRGLELHAPDTIFQTVERIGQRVAQLLTRHPDRSAAILVRENKQGRFISELLRNPGHYNLSTNLGQLEIALYDVGEQERYSHVPAEILAFLQFLDRPHSPDYLKAVLKILMARKLIPSQDLNLLTGLPERFLFPSPLDPPLPDPVLQAQRYCASLLRARLELPHYQLIPFLALTLNYDQTELATADKLAERIAQQTAMNQSLPSVIEVLVDIVGSERFEPVETEDTESRYTRNGQLTIITMHKAKGLDWDYVFIPFLHEHTIPGKLWVPPQAQFIGDFSLAAIARAQIRASIHHDSDLPDVDAAWERANYLSTAEEYRLLYVAMTRAKRLLWMAAARQAPFSWNKPDNLEEKAPCPLLPALSQQFPAHVMTT
ncbi:MAG: ATP-dependent helicase [Elainellaceae cyanobacterium]